MDLSDEILQEQLCRLCRKPSDNRTSIFELDAQHQMPVSQMIASCTGVRIYDFDRLPQHICVECLGELGRAYSIRDRCVSSRNNPQSSTGDFQCHVCSTRACGELISMSCTTEEGSELIKDIFRKFCGQETEAGDGLAPYLCRECCSRLERGFAFKQRCLQVEASFIEEIVYPWEKMEFEAEDSTKLVVDPYARIVIDEADPRIRKCSVCYRRQSPGQISTECEGCWLKFRKGGKPRRELQQRGEQRINVLSSNPPKESLKENRIEQTPATDADDVICVDQNLTQVPMGTRYIRDFLAKHSLTLEIAFPTLKEFTSYSIVQRKIPMCHDCNELFPSKGKLAKHCTKKHAESRRQFVCSVCLTRFATGEMLQLHTQAGQHGIYEYCKLCNRVLLPGRIGRHLKMSHAMVLEEVVSVPEVVPVPARIDEEDFISMECELLEATDMHNVDDHNDMDCNITETSDIPSSVSSVAKLTSPQKTGAQQVLPMKKIRNFLERNSLKMQALFDVLEDTEYGLKLRRKKPLCCACNKMFFTKKALKSHIRKTHPKPAVITKYTCRMCFTKFNIERQYKLHIRRQELQKSLYDYCKQCDKIMTRPKNLTSHLFYFHSTDQERLQIEAKFSCTSVSACNGTKAPTEGENGTVRCEECEKDFKSKKYMLQHINQKEYTCRVGDCEHKTEYRVEMIEHCMMVPHTDLQNVRHVPYDTLEEQFDIIESEKHLLYCRVRRKGPICCGCDMFFADETERSAHAEIFHKEIDDDATWRCGLCCDTFNNSENFDKHKQKLDSFTYDYCVRCELVLMVDSYDRHVLKRHPMTDELHDRIEKVFAMSSETRFKCCVSECSTRFNRSVELLEHCNEVHRQGEATDENTCSVCGTRFDVLEELIKHRDRQFEFIRFSCKSEKCSFTTHSRVKMAEHEPDCIEGRKKMPKSKKIEKKASLDELIDIIERNERVCCGCKKVFKSAEKLQKHVVEYHSEIKDDHPFRCIKCNRGFSQESYLKKHLWIKGDMYYCQECEIQLKDMRQVNHHKMFIHSDLHPVDLEQYYEKIEFDKFPCCGCDQQFHTEDDLAKHCSQSHQHLIKRPIPKYTCKQCHQHVSSNKFPSHTALYASKIIYKCKIKNCVKKTASLKAIRHHVSAEQHEKRIYLKPSIETRFCCIVGCRFSADSHEEIVEHCISEHHKSRESNKSKFVQDLYSCSACCKSFDSPIKLHNHQRKSTIATCTVCGKKVPYEGYDVHLEECRATFRELCPQCGEEFAKRDKFLAHVRIVHKGKGKNPTKKVVCNVCGKTVTDLAGHMASHENKREFGCEQCPLRFNHRSVLRIHVMAVHSNVKRFECRMGCENRYKARADRDRHERIVHTRDLRFPCTFCSDAFVRNRDLRLHMQKHTGRKLYTCSRCPADFNKKSELTEHEVQCFVAVSC